MVDEFSSFARMPEAEINALIGQAREMGKKFSEEFTGIAKSIWDIEFETRELAILPNALNNFLSPYFYNWEFEDRLPYVPMILVCFVKF